jgi:hypothetical protein
MSTNAVVATVGFGTTPCDDNIDCNGGATEAGTQNEMGHADISLLQSAKCNACTFSDFASREMHVLSADGTIECGLNYGKCAPSVDPSFYFDTFRSISFHDAGMEFKREVLHLSRASLIFIENVPELRNPGAINNAK